MNIQLVRQRIREFLTIRIKIYQWDLDYPDTYYYQQSPANTAIEIPVQNVIHSREGSNLIKTSARFPYRITYIFPKETHPSYHDLPLKAVEGLLSNTHIQSLLQTPDSNILNFEPVQLEDSVTVYKTEGGNQDWLVSLNLAFDATFNTTEFSDISDLQPPDYYSDGIPVPIEELRIRTNRAKPGFSKSDSSTFIEDSNIILN